ncbi:TRIO and F-actin-binding protein [Nematolebias whitei]|uniref:TRIO and F-actin-binding protein n=1 Tax=Nematolebias whitei TaxID=451745 RepID=UPI00189B8BBE|nr:TRIO and F-actin-binding protein [Nematolebias whitei]
MYKKKLLLQKDLTGAEGLGGWSLSDSSSENLNPRPRRPSSGQPCARFTRRDSGYEAASSATFNQDDRRCQTAGGGPGADVFPAGQREDGEGWDREQAKRLEERNKWFEAGATISEMSSRWDSMELKKGNDPAEAADSEVSRKWAEFETLSFRDLSEPSLFGPQAYPSSTLQESESPASSQTFHRSSGEAGRSGSQTSLPTLNEAASLNGVAMPQKNAAALQQEVETTKQERAASQVEVDSPCGPGAPCRAKLGAMAAAHRQALQELQEKHVREKKELEGERDRLLQERSQAAAKDMEALKAAHREVLEREVEKVRRSSGEADLVDSSCRGHMPQADVLHGGLNVMSERFAQKCLELNGVERSSKSRETTLELRQRELEQLQRENQELKNKLAEEISRMRYFITGQRSHVGSVCRTEDAASDLETLVRAKEHEVQHLKTEISCLQSEVQSLTEEKEAAYTLYKEASMKLSDARGRSQLEMNSLNEHLRLVDAALQEGARQT